MEKIKIISLSSETYPEGRIDSFNLNIKNKNIQHTHIIPLFLELGFKKK